MIKYNDNEDKRLYLDQFIDKDVRNWLETLDCAGTHQLNNNFYVYVIDKVFVTEAFMVTKSEEDIDKKISLIEEIVEKYFKIKELPGDIYIEKPKDYPENPVYYYRLVYEIDPDKLKALEMLGILTD